MGKKISMKFKGKDACKMRTCSSCIISDVKEVQVYTLILALLDNSQRHRRSLKMPFAASAAAGIYKKDWKSLEM